MTRQTTTTRRPTGVSAINYKGQLGGDVNEQKNYVDITDLTFNPNSESWSLFVEIFNPMNILNTSWYNITIYSQNDGTGTGRSWITIPLAAPNQGKISSALGGGTTRTSEVFANPGRRQTILLTYTKAGVSGTLQWYIDGTIRASHVLASGIEAATGSHRIGASKNDPTLTPTHGTRCYPGLIGRIQFYTGVALTANEARLFHSGVLESGTAGGTTYYPILKYDMQQNSGNVVDSSGNNYTGTLVESAEWVDNYVEGIRTPLTSSRNLSGERNLI